MNIINKTEQSRGCGYRKPGGIYLVCDGPGIQCGMLPVILAACPTCNCGIKFSRALTKIQARLIQKKCTSKKCLKCGPQSLPPETLMALIWIGKSFYSTPQSFLNESKRMGISRRIKSLPRWFEVGTTWVALAQHGIPTGQLDDDGEPIKENRVFAMFQPQRVEYIIKETDTTEFLEGMEKRGFTLVRVKRDIDENLFNQTNNLNRS